MDTSGKLNKMSIKGCFIQSTMVYVIFNKKTLKILFKKSSM